MRYRWRLAALAAVALAALAAVSPAAAQERGRVIAVIADGQARAEPDVAILNAGVQADGQTAREALDGANGQMQNVLAALQGLGIAQEDIQTSGVNLFTLTAPEKPGPGGLPEVIGYRASNNVTVTIRDLSRVDAVLDAVVGAGANNLGGLHFTVSDTAAMHERALADAVGQARPLAEAIAKAAGLPLGEIESVEELSTFGGPIPAAAGKGAGLSTVEPGTLTFQVQVRVTFRVAG
jgi:uncharacterized protein YggE